jgi:predicted RNA-binding protein with PIN domain
MPLLIDGYNLLFAAGWISHSGGSKELARARGRLLHHLVQHLSPETRRQTVIVFDAKDAPLAAPSEYHHQELRVLFARDQAEADDLIEQLLRRDSTPRQLTVVSSDMRLRVAARRRGAQSVKSEDWLDQIERSSSESSDVAARAPNRDFGKPDGLSEGETAAWLNEFEFHPRVEPSEPSTTPHNDDWGPFPPGYGDDLLDDPPG